MHVQHPKKEMVDNGKDSPPTNLQQAAQEHPVHSFQWHWSNQRPTTVTCNEAGTVEGSLKKSSQFGELVKKHKEKELVIIRDGKALSPHFPCVLLKNNECVTVRFVKAVNKSKKPARAPVVGCCKKTPCELVAFHVLASGGKNIVKILKNPELKKLHEITVYACKGETVRHAFRRDGRFLKAIFTKNYALLNRGTEVITEQRSLVDGLDGGTFQIILLNKSNLPDSQPGSLDDAYIVANETENQSESESGSAQKNEPELNGNMEPEKILQEIPRSKEIKNHLSSQFTHCVEKLKPQRDRLSRIQNVLRVEFGQNAQMCREVKTMKKLMDLSDSVCQVRMNGRPCGSGFLLFGRYVLTNAHVINDYYNENWEQLDGKASVHFSYESIEQTEGFDVESVVCLDYCPDVSGRDWALLRLSANEGLPVGLLKHFGPLPQRGGICIIGHPEGSVKKIDPCLIVPLLNRNSVVEKHYNENRGHVQLVTPSFFENVARSVEQKKKALTYESCFYFGSSGSPVFNVDCKVVAMHTGGYDYCGENGENRSVIEYGQPLTDIMEHLIAKLVERKKLDVLKEYLACSYPHQLTIMDGARKLVESRNLRALIKDVSGLVDMDASLKSFFTFFSLKEEPVPMDTD